MRSIVQLFVIMGCVSWGVAWAAFDVVDYNVFAMHRARFLLNVIDCVEDGEPFAAYECLSCWLKGEKQVDFESIALLWRHCKTQKHTHNAIFYCPYIFCFVHSDTYDEIYQHVIDEHDYKIYICFLCEYNFKNSTELKKHECKQSLRIKKGDA